MYRPCDVDDQLSSQIAEDRKYIVQQVVDSLTIKISHEQAYVLLHFIFTVSMYMLRTFYPMFHCICMYVAV